MGSELNFDRIPKLIGMDSDLKRWFHMLNSSKRALFFVGDAGTGKTVAMQNLAKAYAKKHGVKARYVQGTLETTKTGLIAGHRLVNGSLVPVKAVVGQAMEEGGIVIVDELPHMMPEVMLMFNSVLDRWGVTSIGDIAIEAKDTFRIIFGGNRTTHMGNNALPQSLASRLFVVDFDYPSFGNELKITRNIVEDEYVKENRVPGVVERYVVGLFRQYRTPTYPLTPRNMAAAIIALNAEVRYPDTEGIMPFTVPNEAVARNLCGLAHVSEAKIADVAKEFEEFISKIGADRFRAGIEGAALISLSIDTGADTGARNKLTSAILTDHQQTHEVPEDDDDDSFYAKTSAKHATP